VELEPAEREQIREDGDLVNEGIANNVGVMVNPADDAVQITDGAGDDFSISDNQEEG
jgi:hypothetical protein